MTQEEKDKDLATQIKNLTEVITAKFSKVEPTDEAKLLAARVQALEDEKKQKSLKRKMIWAITGKEPNADEEKIHFVKYLRAIAKNDHAFLAEVKAATGMSEGTDADGGYLVPTEVANFIMPLIRMNSIARRICRILPMGGKTRTIPSQLTNPTITWTGEGVNKTLTKVTLENITQTAKKLAAIVALTDELLEDAPETEAFVIDAVAKAFGREEDRVAFVGDVTGASDPFDGVYYMAGVNSVSMTGAALGYGDLVALIYAVGPQYRTGSRLVLDTTAIQAAMTMVDDNNRPIWSPSIQEGAPPRILGFPYEETDVLSAIGGQNPALFGNFGEYLILSPRGSYKVDSTNAGTDGTNHGFLKNETWFRFEERLAITVAVPAAFSKMLVA